MSRTWTFRIDGRPTPQGSKKAMRLPGGRPIMVESSTKHLKPWREALTVLSRERAPHEPLTGAVRLDAEFHLARPQGHYGSGRNERKLKPSAPAHPTTRSRGDLSKLVRALEDALTEAGWWLDDSQIVCGFASKRFVDRFTQREGCTITITEVE